MCSCFNVFNHIISNYIRRRRSKSTIAQHNIQIVINSNGNNEIENNEIENNDTNDNINYESSDDIIYDDDDISYESNDDKIYNKEEIFNIENYKHEFLEKGSCATMLYCITIDNKKYTCKKFEKKNVDRFLVELDNIKTLKGKRLPDYYDLKADLSHFYILYNFVPGEDLYYSFSKNKKIIKKNHKLIAEIIYEIALGLKELFLQNYIHLDIKPENIIISSLNPVKLTIIDLAYCQNLSKKNRKTNKGTYGWTSPEIILYNTYYYNTDIWSLGLILYLLLTGKMLFNTNDKYEYFDCIADFTNLHGVEDLDVKNIPNNALYLLDNMIQNIHTYRYTIDQVLKSSFLKQVDK
tara:strand:- start:1271 stop:2323 length:1053 start_codon:yes stop_codon:yes gene_type:complete